MKTSYDRKLSLVPSAYEQSWRPKIGDEDVKPNKKRLKMRYLLGALAIAIGITGAYSEQQDSAHDDLDAVKVTASTSPNPTVGAERAIQEQLPPNYADKIDTSELGAELEEAVYDATGESSRKQGNHIVTFKVEKDGDVINVRVTK